MDVKNVHPFGIKTITRTQGRSEVDYVKGTDLFKGSGAASVMVTAESDLENLEGYNPGTIAYTAGFGSIWQLAADGTWVEV